MEIKKTYIVEYKHYWYKLYKCCTGNGINVAYFLDVGRNPEKWDIADAMKLIAESEKQFNI